MRLVFWKKAKIRNDNSVIKLKKENKKLKKEIDKLSMCIQWLERINGILRFENTALREQLTYKGKANDSHGEVNENNNEPR